ncbi:hypothetical protein [Microbulbifer rhizosphaerae]|uniref:Uncharacterized protein n=1 Tax=Microbulbifer rhizosphaerae TaxID=1562603 RepID=A0A7W4WG59_9GAMM|nr:hypothetical protein [Microbulbifer rhizosphaerae]MBB3063616.1 hypothetical protein [Microbulbifer rhizosphaerae]
MDDEIEFRLIGEGIKPGSVRSHELAEILEAVETFASAEALEANPDLAKDELVVGLYHIADESIGLRFKTTMAAAVLPAFIAASQAIAESDFDALAPQSLKSLQTVAAFTKRHNCKADIQLPGSARPLASITAETLVPPPGQITGSTELVGKVLRVGGKVPRAMIEMLDGSVIYCDVALDVAKDLGHKLYSFVVLQGLAAWDTRSIKLQEFSITSFQEFKQEDPLTVLGQLRSNIGHAFSEVDDVPGFVEALRQGEVLQ